jgi:hypothetical protein
LGVSRPAPGKTGGLTPTVRQAEPFSGVSPRGLEKVMADLIRVVSRLAVMRQNGFPKKSGFFMRRPVGCFLPVAARFAKLA